MHRRLRGDDLIDASLGAVSLRSHLTDCTSLCFFGSFNSSRFRLGSFSGMNPNSFRFSSLSSSNPGCLHLGNFSSLFASRLSLGSFSSFEASNLSMRSFNSLDSSSLGLRSLGSLHTSGFSLSNPGSLYLRLLELVVVISIVDVATTLTFSNATRAAFELALDVQKVHHFLCSNPAAALE
jgi:hypothetical protein